MKLNTLKGLPNNPRFIKDAEFMRLVDKVLSLPDGLKANRIAYVTDGCEVEGQWRKGTFILSGNQRHKVLQHIVKMTDDNILEYLKLLKCEHLAEFWYGFKERGELPSDWVQDVTHLDASDRRHFILAMNVSDGAWDNDILANEWDAGELSWAGVDRWEAEDVGGDGESGTATPKSNILTITFASPEHLQEAENDVQELIDRKYNGATYKVKV